MKFSDYLILIGGVLEADAKFLAVDMGLIGIFFLCARAAQYACTLLGYTLLKGGASKDLLSKVKLLEGHLSLARKREYGARVAGVSVPQTRSVYMCTYAAYAACAPFATFQ